MTNTLVLAGPRPAPAPFAPDALLGKWQCGAFDMTTFWAYDGRYQGAPFERAMAFEFHPGGFYEKYTLSTWRDYANCATETFDYERGRIVFNVSPGTFETRPTEAHSRQFHSCFPNLDWSRWRPHTELTPQTCAFHLHTNWHGTPELLLVSLQGGHAAGVFLEAAW